MHPRFSIEVDQSRDMVRIVLTGMFLLEDVADFLEARRKSYAKLTCAPGRLVALTDLRELKIMPQDTVDAWAAHLTSPKNRLRRMAFVVAPTLVLGQLKRALAGRDKRDARTFTDPAEAEAWLLDEDGAAQ